jgi:hypothetical protein
MKASSLLGLGIGLVSGSAIADSLIDDDNPVAKLATGFIAADVTTKLATDLLRETGVSDVIDDLFNW